MKNGPFFNSSFTLDGTSQRAGWATLRAEGRAPYFANKTSHAGFPSAFQFYPRYSGLKNDALQSKCSKNSPMHPTVEFQLRKVFQDILFIG